MPCKLHQQGSCFMQAMGAALCTSVRAFQPHPPKPWTSMVLQAVLHFPLDWGQEVEARGGRGSQKQWVEQWLGRNPGTTDCECMQPVEQPCYAGSPPVVFNIRDDLGFRTTSTVVSMLLLMMTCMLSLVISFNTQKIFLSFQAQTTRQTYVLQVH